MMRRQSVPFAALAMTGTLALSISSTLLAQNSETAAGSASRARSTSERVNTEASTPPPVNSDYRRAAEGSLPVVPGATTLGGPAIDPAARGLGGSATSNGVLGSRGAAALPPGLDAALLIEHAVDMGLDSSILSSLAAANKPDENGNDAVKALLTHASDELRASKELLGKAAAAGANLDANSPVRKFYHAAANYMAALASLSEPGAMASPNNNAEMAMINHSIKAVMDASHISQFGSMGAPSPAMDGLLNHAKLMRDEGMKNLDRIAGTNPVDPNSPPSPVTLAQRGKELVEAADALAPLASQMYGAAGGSGGGLNGNLNTGLGPNPGRLQNNQPEIIGGTYGTGSQTAGTATGAEAARNVKNSTEGPNGVLSVPTPNGAPGTGPSGYGVGNNNTPPTQSTAGSRPR